MTLQEAYHKAKTKEAARGRPRLYHCADFGEFWAFNFGGSAVNKEVNGYADIIINKKTGEIKYTNPAFDPDLYDNAKPIPIEQFAEVA